MPTTLLNYPDVIEDAPAVIPFNWSQNQAVLVSEFENGREQRRLLWNSVRRTVELNYNHATLENADKIYQFYSLVQGPLEPFLFYFPTFNSYYEERVGTAEGGETQIFLPSMGADEYTLFRGGIPLVEGSEYSFIEYTGPNLVGSDYASLVTSALEGDTFHFSFKGRLKMKARFSEEPVVSNEIGSCFYSFSVSLVQLQHEVDIK